MLRGSGASSRNSRLVIPPIRNLRQGLRVQRAEGLAQRVGRERAVQPRVEDVLEHVVPGVGDLHGLREQLGVVMHDDAVVAQRLGERVVLGLRLGHPQHVVEEQLGGVLRGEPLQLQAGPVQDDLVQAADL